jgi:hypothetical protein
MIAARNEAEQLRFALRWLTSALREKREAMLAEAEAFRLQLDLKDGMLEACEVREIIAAFSTGLP